MGWILFGLDDAILGAVITTTAFEREFNLSTSMQGTVTSLFELGCFAGALLVSLFGERFSRRGLLFIYTVPMIIGSVIQVAAQNTGMLIAGRMIAGVGLGGITSTLPSWQNETSPAKLRGTVICTSLSFLIIGQLIAYWAGYGLLQQFPTENITWRLLFALQTISVSIMAFMVLFMPESPRWLIAHGRYDQARSVVSCLLNRPENDILVNEQIEDMTRAITFEQEHGATWTDLFTFKKNDDGPREKRRVFTVSNYSLETAQPFSGSTVLSFYLTTIFEGSVGFSEHLSTLMSGFLQVWFLLASFLTWFLIERAGRRNCFMVTAICMGITMVVLAAMVKVNTKPTGYVATVCLFLYQSFFTWGWMAGVWCYSNEILSTTYRAKGGGLCVALQWLFDFVILQVTPIGIDQIGWGMFLVFAVFNFAYAPLVWFFCPETAGVPLESIDAMYLPGVDPVKESKRIRKHMKEQATERYVHGGENGKGERHELGRITSLMGENKPEERRIENFDAGTQNTKMATLE
uniref:Major facilitator superfamily (MFS) profile domain-containing protein n=1 Tax=Kwoniella dejecticola CBS 10117 TaxID=1296121 RepID=A0A1A6ABI2_9TREE|nr:uncharacterized protein I303_01611 [Kwoniella dejecticola CBS 10117]OBR87409.1 hypothetical protein I303_01611 [Kwoniella dejecticola CBS 10117]